MQISRVAVIGMGTMGKGICQLLASNGFGVSVLDVSEDVVDVGISDVASNLERLTEKGKITNSKSAEIMSNISRKRIDDLVNEDLIIECVNENLSVKHQLFMNLDSIAGRNVILATNTSSFTIREIFGDLLGHRMAVGMHFFNPVMVLPLVELVLPRNCPKQLSDALKDFLFKNGRKIVEVRDSPGFVVNRILFKMIAESLLLSEEGVTSREEIDMAMKSGANFPMGPFELVDFIGVDVSKGILENLARQTGSQDMANASNTLDSFISKGWLGRKSGRGFYEYAGQSRTRY